MITLINPSTNNQDVKYYSTKRTIIPTLELSSTAPEIDFCACRFQCVPCLKFFTDEFGLNPDKNDFFSLYQNSIIGGSHKVFYSTDNWKTEIEITNDNFGQLFNGVNWYGYEFHAYKIWQQIGYKEFSAQIRNYDSSMTLVQTKSAACRKLMKFSDRAAHGTITIESRKRGILRHGSNYSGLQLSTPGVLIKYWRQQIRLSGCLKMKPMAVENTRLMLNDNVQSSLQVFDKGDIDWEMVIELASAEQVMPVIFDDFFANTVLVSDFNLLNYETYRKVRLIRQTIDWPVSKSQRRKNIVVTLKREESNIEKFND